MKELKKKILALAGRKSYTLIAGDLGISRSAVSGVIWRSKWSSSRCKKASGRHNVCGKGHWGSGPFANEWKRPLANQPKKG